MDSIKPSRPAIFIASALTSLALVLSAWDRIFGGPSSIAAAALVLAAGLAAAAIVSAGYWLSGRSGLGVPVLDRLGRVGQRPAAPRRWLGLGLAVGLLVGGLGLLSMRLVFLAGNPGWRAAWANEATWPLWRRTALAFEAGVLEEVLFRFVLLSLVVWAISGFRKVAIVRPAVFWAANGVVAVLFGLAHLAKPFPLTAAEAAMIILINGVGAGSFGYVYWKKGLESAVVAHVTADFIVRVIGHFLV